MIQDQPRPNPRSRAKVVQRISLRHDEIPPYALRPWARHPGQL